MVVLRPVHANLNYEYKIQRNHSRASRLFNLVLHALPHFSSSAYQNDMHTSSTCLVTNFSFELCHEVIADLFIRGCIYILIDDVFHVNCQVQYTNEHACTRPYTVICLYTSE